MGILTTFILLITSSIYNFSIFRQEFPACFVFGDSLVDVGNSNYIATVSRANYPPFGIDFGESTGRFTNGRTVVDIIGQQLGSTTFIPPYLAPSTRGSVIMHGVNYASGAAGILNETGRTFIEVLNFDEQLDNFANTRQDLIKSIGEQATNELLDKAFFTVNMGSSDLLDNYMNPLISRVDVEPNLITQEAFVNAMISKYRVQLTRLFNMGAKKIIVVNVGPIGCIPYIRERNPSAGDDCVALLNRIAQQFNFRLKSLLVELSNTLHGSLFVYADVYHVVDELLMNYKSYGFENANSACCYVGGKFGGLSPCIPTSKVCTDRSKYVFWDPYHPSDVVNVLIANRLIDGDSSVISPLNIRQLLHS